jgi:hypothetical protein
VTTSKTVLDVKIILKWTPKEICFIEIRFDRKGSIYSLAAVILTLQSQLVLSAPGTVSIMASRRVRGAVGVESVHSAVTDARNNALANGAYNVEFIQGLAEKVCHVCSREIEVLHETWLDLVHWTDRVCSPHKIFFFFLFFFFFFFVI